MMNAPAYTIVDAPQQIRLAEGMMEGRHLIHTQKTVGELAHFYLNESARKSMNQDEVIYRVQAHLPVADGTPGGLYFGTTWIKPGLVDREYYMTKGHFHALPDRSEYYWGLQGEGILILMDRQRRCWGERMHPGSLHYIPAHTAHRVANTGDTELSFGACWPSDAGHDYDEIARNGFSCRLLRINGKPELVSESSLRTAL